MKTTKSEVVKELWYRGELSWLLYKHQRPIYNKIREVIASTDPDVNSFVIDCARQFGKSFTEFLISVEECIRQPNKTIVFIGPLKSQVNEIINGKTFGTIFATAPKDLVPVLKDSALVFSNGSRIRLAGTDNHNYENLRGGAADLIFLDEAGFMSDLEDGVLPTVEPMTKTTKGKVIFSSTPPESLDHDYHDVLRYHEEAQLIATFTIWDDKTLSEKDLKRIISQCKGKDTIKFKREYECQRIADSSRQVIPGFSIERQELFRIKDTSYRDSEFYPYWKKYVVADWGGKDKTAIVFAHYNFRTKLVIVEDHLDLNGEDVTPGVIARKIAEKTSQLWQGKHDITYYCDNNMPLLQQDMNITYRLPFVATSKGRLDQMVEKVKDWEYDERIRFSPDAEVVLKSTAAAHWNKSRDEFARSKVYGHYDHCAALIYLVRNVDEVSDPIPVLHGRDPYKQFIDPALTKQLAGQYQELANIFNPRKGASFRR